MNRKLVKMMRSIQSALNDKSCSREAEILVSFVHNHIVHNSGASFLGRKVFQEVGKAKPKKIKATISAYGGTSTTEVEKAAEILGVSVEIYVEPPL